MTRWILDAGPLVAYLDQSDSAHDLCADTLEAFTGELHTTSAAIVETLHFLQELPDGADALVQFLAHSGTHSHDCTSLPQLEQAAQLMRKYADVPMDFTDATLVLLAQELAAPEILTLDRRGFRTFRFSGQKRFQLVLPG